MPKLTEKLYDVEADWKFRSIPVTFSYTYALPSTSTRVVPVIGVGIAAHFFKETHMENNTASVIPGFVGPSSMAFFTNGTNRDRFGLKYGAEVSLGVRTQVTRHIFLMSQGRYRYVNCSIQSLMSKYGSGPVSILDFSVDIGFEF